MALRLVQRMPFPVRLRLPTPVGQVLPKLDGKLNGFALRVPVIDGSITDLTVMLNNSVTRDEVNSAMKAAADGPLRGILEYCEDPIVSSDIIGNPASSIFAKRVLPHL